MSTSIYLHIPFCKHRCAYCDFNTYAGQEDAIPAYVNALIKEIEFLKRQLNGALDVSTIFFGGGTPSLLSAPQFDSILRALNSAFAVSPNAEISLEANPDTVSQSQLDGIRQAGVNRISFGAQSSNSEELRLLERTHDFLTVIEAVAAARKAGFHNLNLDLIYGLPEQTLASWQTTVQRVADLRPEHISAYALTLEHGTPFGRWANRGLLPIPDPDLAADMYEWTTEYLQQSDYAQYEISNWAKGEEQPSAAGLPSFACKHNLQYWRSLPYLGLGAGAHGYADGMRYSNALRIKTYIDRLINPEAQDAHYKFPQTPAAVNHHKQTQVDEISDYLLNNFRLTQLGVSNTDFKIRFGAGLAEFFPAEIESLLADQLIEKKTSENSEVFRLTPRGRLLGNRVFIKFISSSPSSSRLS
ncbi:MAG: radical SAM family heme chaperone HemW [Anaerolineales bacterium]|nr:radical SAM family heme chaperone HemW [Anaerolineales bacterium]